MKNRTYEQRMIMICFMLLVIFILLAMLVQDFKSKEIPGQVIEHIVKSGENLTQIATKYSDEYLPKALCEIKKLNNMTESDLVVGQVLKIEVK